MFFKNLLTLCLHNINLINKLLGFLWIVREVCIPTLQHILNLFHNAHFKKSLDYKIGVMAYTMHTNHECCIILFQ
jgi:hypothetical protein